LSIHSAISPAEAADRFAIRELVDGYAHCADRRDARGQMDIFTADAHFVIFMGMGVAQEYHKREDLAPVFDIEFEDPGVQAFSFTFGCFLEGKASIDSGAKSEAMSESIRHRLPFALEFGSIN
jgi:hypothetical protein